MMQFDEKLQQAEKILAESWPLQALIARNPLWQYKTQSFLETINENAFNMLMDTKYYHEKYLSGEITKNNLFDAICELTDKQLSSSEIDTWIDNTLQLANKQTTEPSILYCDQLEEYEFQTPKEWLKNAILPTLLNYFSQNNANTKLSLLDYWSQESGETITSPIRSIQHYATTLQLSEDILVEYFQQIYCALYGWSSLIYWLKLHPDNPWIQGSASCHDILALWLYYESRIYNDTQQNYKPPKHNCNKAKLYREPLYTWQLAFEKGYIHRLINQLMTHKPVVNQTKKAQCIFCIDVRSEGLRRHLEATGYETFGVAGFFGVLFKLKHQGQTSYQTPAIVKPKKTLNTTATHHRLATFIKTVKTGISQAKQQLLSPFVLFEAIGIWHALSMFSKTIIPDIFFKKNNNSIQLNITINDSDGDFTVQEATDAAASLLKSIGLHNNFAESIIICGHQTDTVNNPFKAALNCGACGGNSGIPNAIAMTTILNHSAVRQKLQQHGITIPETTQFIAACHHTTHDRIEILSDIEDDSFTADFDSACQQLRTEKTRSLPGYHALSRREVDWSELIPEQGLVNNAALIIGPRRLTAQLDLERRVFLHSYEPHTDPDGEILTNLLSAPGIVAHWISAEYYFSTVNPSLFGAGNKAIHNILPGVGVIEGNLSDLKVGLAEQSVYYQSTPLHEPRRLCVVVYATKPALNNAMAQASEFRQLVENQWVHFRHIET